MKKFLTKVLIFCSPLLIVFLIPASILCISGENYRGIDSVVENGKNYLIGYAYNEDNYKYLKYKELENRQSLSVVALGSSRILQFRDKMFTKPFYNAGYTISRISNYIPFIEANLLKNKPKVLLINLDQWMFNEKWDDLSAYSQLNKELEPNFRKSASVTTLFNVWDDLIKGKYGFEVLTQHDNSNIVKVGLNANVNNKGFRNDGSMFYGDQIKKLLTKDSTANDFNYSDTFTNIANGNNRFQYGNQINVKFIKALKDLLNYCRENGIYVVAILPPFADKVNLQLTQSKQYAYMDHIYIKSKDLFKDAGFELWDMSHLGKYNSNDSETIDGFHGGEVAYLKMLIYMVENGSILKNYTDTATLKNDLANRKNNYTVY